MASVRRQRYKEPRFLDARSVGLFFLFLALGYLGYGYLPVLWEYYQIGRIASTIADRCNKLGIIEPERQALERNQCASHARTLINELREKEDPRLIVEVTVQRNREVHVSCSYERTVKLLGLRPQVLRLRPEGWASYQE